MSNSKRKPQPRNKEIINALKSGKKVKLSGDIIISSCGGEIPYFDETGFNWTQYLSIYKVSNFEVIE